MQKSRNRIVVRFDAGFLLVCAGAIFFLPIKWLFGFLVSVVVHELAHYIALVLLGVKIHAVLISGNGIIIKTGVLSNIQEFICAMAGPIGGLLFMFAFYRVPYISVCAFVQSVYNLLPIETLDGSRALKCLLLGYRKSETIFRFLENLTCLMVCVLLCFIAIASAKLWVWLLVILVICRLWHQKYLAKKQNQ